VTVLTLAGALGIGPGAAAQSSATTPSGGSTSGPTGPAGGRTPVGGSKSHPGGDGWVTVQRTPVGPSQPSAAGATDSPGATAVDVPAKSGHGKRVVYDVSAQRIWLVDKGDVVARTYLASGSEHGNVPTAGRYQVTSRSRHSTYSNGKETLNYLVRFTSGKQSAAAFSDIPARSDGTLVESQSQLGSPVSTDAIRQWITDAKALWEFVSVGTPVVVKA
jgi:hypothetical protein